MNDFKESIKLSANDKKVAVVDLWNAVVNAYLMNSIEEVQARQQNIKEKLTREEFLATYEISKEAKKLMLAQRTESYLLKFLQLSNLGPNEDRLMKMVDATVTDIKRCREETPNLKWYFQPLKIIKRMETAPDAVTRVYGNSVCAIEDK